MWIEIEKKREDYYIKFRSDGHVNDMHSFLQHINKKSQRLSGEKNLSDNKLNHLFQKSKDVANMPH